MAFPTPVGGTPFSEDFAPSVLFAVLYAVLVPIMLYRVYDKSSRTTLLIGSIIFGVERVVVFSLRAVQSQSENKRISQGLITYMQVSFGMGFIGIASDLVNLMRSLLVNPTFGSDMYEQCSAHQKKSDPSSSLEKLTPVPRHMGDFPGEPPKDTPDNPDTRSWCRRFSGLTNLAFLAATVPGVIANSSFGSVINDPVKGRKIGLLRYASCGVALFLTFILAIAGIWARSKLPRVSRRGATTMTSLSLLLSTIAIYRLSVMHYTVTSVLSTAPGSLNSTGAKATFYIFHALPEWLCNATLFTFNIRQMLGTGLFGDYRQHDETPKEREKRLKREAKKAEKRKKKLALKSSDIKEKGILVTQV